jgi:hypothetical protein
MAVEATHFPAMEKDKAKVDEEFFEGNGFKANTRGVLFVGRNM